MCLLGSEGWNDQIALRVITLEFNHVAIRNRNTGEGPAVRFASLLPFYYFPQWAPVLCSAPPPPSQIAKVDPSIKLGDLNAHVFAFSPRFNAKSMFYPIEKERITK